MADPREVIWRPIKGTSQELGMSCTCDSILLAGARGSGKDISLETSVLTDTGWVFAKDVTYKHKLVALDGTYTNIIGIYPKTDRQMCRVEFRDGMVIRADLEHLWLVRQTQRPERGWKVVATQDLLEAPQYTYSIPYLTGPVQGDKWRGFDPYMVGLMLGDGTTLSDHPCLYSKDQEIIDYAVRNHGWYAYEYKDQVKRATCPTYKASFVIQDIPCVKSYLKRIPPLLKIASAVDRLAVLQGLMDADGGIEKNGKMAFRTTSIQLAEDVREIVWSLGGAASIRWKAIKNSTFNSKFGGYWKVSIACQNKFVPFRLSRRLERIGKQVQQLTRGIKSVTISGIEDGVCFQVDHPSACFVIQGYVVTHNTTVQLMRFRKRVGIGYGAFWRGIIFDTEYKDLDDLVAQSKRLFLAFEDGAKFLSASSQYKWVWPTGEELLFRTGDDEDDYWAFHGTSVPYIGVNELTKQHSPTFIDMMMSCNRSSFQPELNSPVDMHTGERRLIPPIPLELICTTNPYGIGRNWVKKRYIDPAPYGKIVRTKIEIISPKTKQPQIVEKTQVTIFGSYVENIYLPDAYIAQLHQETDKNKKKAWLGGRWDISAGGAFDDLWDDTVHILERFPIPENWPLDRAFDWGSTHPFSVGWWAEANGEEVKLANGRPFLHRGRPFAPASGTLIMFAEWYGSEEVNWGSNKGVKMSSTDIAIGILAAEASMRQSGMIKSKVSPGPADNQIRNVNDSGSETIEKKMLDKGVEWEVSDKSPGSRINGFQLFRERLEAAKRQEGPAIYFMRNCRAAIQLIPSLPLHPTIPDETHQKAEDHIWDGTRYRVLKSSNRIAANVVVRTAS